MVLWKLIIFNALIFLEIFCIDCKKELFLKINAKLFRESSENLQSVNHSEAYRNLECKSTQKRFSEYLMIAKVITV